MEGKANLKVEYEVEVVKDGKILKKVKGESRSLLKNFIAWLRSRFLMDSVGSGTGHNFISPWQATDITGTGRTLGYDDIQAPVVWGGFGAGEGLDTLGLVIGMGDTPVSPIDYDLADRITHGTGLNQMLHGSMTIEDVVVSDSQSSFRVSRTFTNNSGASITVKEIGAIFRCWEVGGGDRRFLYLRDVLSSPTTVPDGAALTVRYTFKVVA